MTTGARSDAIVVIGGGISGITTAVEAAEAGKTVTLLEREAYLGGRVARMNEYFPKLCPPPCGLEINFRRIKQNPRIRVFTQAEVTAVKGGPGAYTVTARLAPRYVNERCTACDACVAACPEQRPDDFNYGLGKTKAIYLPHLMAYPRRHVIDAAACPGISCARCLPHCAVDAIDLGEQPRTLTLHAGAVVLATDWKPYDARRMENLGYGRLQDVVTNVQLERLASRGGPTEGRILRPSDGGPIQRVAFVQCAGSRDEHHLDYCSTVCCTATLKQATYIRQQYPEAEIHIFYIDIRTMGTLEGFAARVQADPKIFLHKGKVAKVWRRSGNDLVVVAEEMADGRRLERVVDLVVLATGMQPEAHPGAADADGFVPAGEPQGMHGAGCARRPVEVAAAVQDATAAALYAIQDLRR